MSIYTVYDHKFVMIIIIIYPTVKKNTEKTIYKKWPWLSSGSRIVKFWTGRETEPIKENLRKYS